METENSFERFSALRDILFQEPQIKENLFVIRAMSDDKDAIGTSDVAVAVPYQSANEKRRDKDCTS
jgi:hypothetical protein